MASVFPVVTRAARAAEILGLIYLFLLGLDALGDGFKLLGRDVAEAFIQATENPFAGLAVGVLTTSVVQSSSVTTSMVVGLVAAGNLPVINAVPMIMGANIGTTVTNTMVSFGHVTRPAEFRRAMAFGTLDDFFNLCALAVLFPLEIVFHPLQRLSALLVGWIRIPPGSELSNPLQTATEVLVEPTRDWLVAHVAPELASVLILLSGAALIFAALNLLVRRLHEIGEARLQATVRGALGTTPARGFVIGMVATTAVQSSSVVLSLLVPLAGTGALTLAQGFPLALGANVGTTITALLAASGAPAEALAAAIQVGLVHLLFNLTGSALIYPVPRLRRIPMGLAEWIADVAVRSKVRALTYLVFIFYGIPGVGIILL